MIGLTVLGYRYEGLRYEDFTEALDKLLKDFSLEGGPPAERPSAQKYKHWLRQVGASVCGDDEARASRGCVCDDESETSAHLVRRRNLPRGAYA